MAKITIFHGGISIVKNPEFGKGKPYNDYGQGFYCTKEIELAKEWAVAKERDGFVSEYTLQKNGLKILRLDEKYHILNWMAILLENRYFNMSAISEESKGYILHNYMIEYKSYDVIIGYRADDSYFAFANDFISNAISVEKLSEAMYLGKLGLQVFIQSEKAFNQIEFVDSYAIDYEEYFPKYKQRDTKARDRYHDTKKSVFEGLFVRDIIVGGVKNDDSRLPRILVKKRSK